MSKTPHHINQMDSKDCDCQKKSNISSRNKVERAQHLPCTNLSFEKPVFLIDFLFDMPLNTNVIWNKSMRKWYRLSFDTVFAFCMHWVYLNNAWKLNGIGFRTWENSWLSNKFVNQHIYSHNMDWVDEYIECCGTSCYEVSSMVYLKAFEWDVNR